MADHQLETQGTRTNLFREEDGLASFHLGPFSDPYFQTKLKLLVSGNTGKLSKAKALPGHPTLRSMVQNLVAPRQVEDPSKGDDEGPAT